MGLSLMTSQRRGRLWLVAVCITFFLVYHAYRTPLSYTNDQTSVLRPVIIEPMRSVLEDDDWKEIPVGTYDGEPEPEPAAEAPVAAYEETASATPLPEPETNTQEEVVIYTITPSATETVSPSSPPTPTCTPFEPYMGSKPGPPSAGKRKFPYVRPPPECRTFKLQALEDLIDRMRNVIKDPDLYRLFENSYPITLDTMVKWRGYANRTDEETGDSFVTNEELTYVITGDIDAMWLRDSASQIYSYLPLLEASTDSDSLASLWRGLINSHARYINISPYCHSFQPPPESGIPPTYNAAYGQNHPYPGYNPLQVFDCKWELDSLASFLQISSAYYHATGDLEFFGRYSWVDAVRAAITAAGAMRKGTYDEEGHVLPSAWTFTGWTDRGSETLTNNGLGNPVQENGMVRTAFRPSDDATIYQLLVPSNMMWAKYLEEASIIMERLAHEDGKNLTVEMRSQAAGIRRGIERDAIVRWRGEEIFAYEVDGFGGVGLMDDANVPSLLAMPLWNYSHSAFSDHTTNRSAKDYDNIYRHTRSFVLSDANPYYAKGPVLSAVGGPHIGPGKAWPMAAIVAGMTAYESASGLDGDELMAEVSRQLGMVLDSTAGMGVVHETVNSWEEREWTRPWFGWANGLLGELILRIEREETARGFEKKGILGRSWQ
jgi:meiotically up-regulated gene 157 (Mug157) protein